MRRHSLARALIAALVLAAPAAAAAATAQTWVVEPTRVHDLKAVFASVESVDVTDARARIGGTVTELRVDDGSRVKGGQVIAVVSDPKLRLQEAALEASIRVQQAELQQARLQLDRIRQLRKTGSTSQAQLDEAQTQFNVVTQRLAAARAERAVTAQRLSEGEVLAPASGRVLKKHVVAGTVVMPGESIATIAVERYVLRLHLPERHARFIKVGDSVLVGARGLSPEQQGAREGRIVKVYPRLVDGQVVADVEVPGLGDYFVGERARVWVATGDRTAILVPPRFISTRYGVDYARLRGPDGHGFDVPVQIGRPRGGAGAQARVEVLSGLRAGDVLLPP